MNTAFSTVSGPRSAAHQTLAAYYLNLHRESGTQNLSNSDCSLNISPRAVTKNTGVAISRSRKL